MLIKTAMQENGKTKSLTKNIPSSFDANYDCPLILWYSLIAFRFDERERYYTYKSQTLIPKALTDGAHLLLRELRLLFISGFTSHIGFDMIIQFPKINIVPLVNKPYVNGLILRGQTNLQNIGSLLRRNHVNSKVLLRLFTE